MALAVPVTLKTTEVGENERLDYAVSAMQGHRVNMEDAHAIVLDLDAALGTSFFGVYDGHGGPAVSKYCARHLHIELRRHESFRDNLQTAIERTFLRMDEMMKDRSAGWELSGYGGNDSWRAYRKAMRKSRFLPFSQYFSRSLPIRGQKMMDVPRVWFSLEATKSLWEMLAIDLSRDFKPNLPGERERIEAAGHEVSYSERGNVHRIDDGIAISRSLGDLLYKDKNELGPQQQAITAFPEVRTEEITQDDQFLIIACDGIWDCQTKQQAFDFIRIYSNTVYEMLKLGSLISKFAYEIRNTVTFILDGSNHEVWEQYTMVMAHLRFWYVSNGVTMNLCPILGYDRFVHIVPFEGTAHVVLRYGTRLVNLIMDAREAWLYGAAGSNTLIQFERKNRTPYIQHEYTISLNGDGRYSQVAKKGVGDIPIGIDALRTMCSVLSEADENTNLDEVEEQLGVAVAHFMEPLKFYKPYEIVSGAIFSGESTTFEETDPTVRYLVKIWGKAGEQLGKYVFGHFCNEPPTPPHTQPLQLNENLNGGGIKSLEDIFENIFIMPRAFIPKRYLEKKKPSDISSMVHSTWQPVDPGRGDPKVIPLENLYRRIQEQREQNIRDNKFIQDRRKYFGDRLGGKPCAQAITFVKSGATSSVFSWKASLPLPVKGNRILHAVQIAKKYCRFFR